MKRFICPVSPAHKNVYNTDVEVDGKRYVLQTGLVNLGLWFCELSFEDKKVLIQEMGTSPDCVGTFFFFVRDDGRQYEVRKVTLPERTVFMFFPTPRS